MNSLEKINIKLIQGLNLLSQTEYKKFITFSSSKYFSGDRDYSKLLESLKDLHSSGFKSFNNQSLINHLVDNLQMSKNTILNRMSELYKIYEKFLLNEHIKDYKNKKTLLLLNYYLDNKSTKLFDYVLNLYNSEIKKEKIDIERIETEYLLSELSAVKNFKSAKFSLFYKQFSQKSEYSIFSFMLKLLKENIEFKQQKFLGYNTDSELSDIIIENLPVEVILKKLKKSLPEMYNLALIQYKMYIAFGDFSNPEAFYEARKIHIKEKSNLKKTENHNIYSLFVTYCINQTNLIKEEFYYNLFEIIDDKLSEGYFDELKTPNIPVNNFRDYVLIGLRVNKIEWVKKFIKEYSVYLPVQYRQDDIYLANGIIALEEKRFEEAIQILKKVRKKNYIHYLDSTFNMLRAFYELKLYYNAFNEVDKIREYFSRNKNIPAVFFQSYNSALNEIILLLKYSEKKSEYDQLYLYCKKVNFKMKSRWVNEEVKKIFKEKPNSVKNYISQKAN